MTPGTYNITIYRGMKFSDTLEFVSDDGLDTPLDLTGLGPFVGEVRARSRGPLIFTIDIDETELAAGKLTISIDPAVTDAVELKLPYTAKLGIRDAEGNYYAIGDAQIEGAIPTPP